MKTVAIPLECETVGGKTDRMTILFDKLDGCPGSLNLELVEAGGQIILYANKSFQASIPAPAIDRIHRILLVVGD